MKVSYTLRAFAEREGIFDYLNARNPQAARALIAQVNQRIEQLGNHPYMGRRTSKPGIFFTLDHTLSLPRVLSRRRRRGGRDPYPAHLATALGIGHERP